MSPQTFNRCTYTYDDLDRMISRQQNSAEQRFVYGGLANDIVAITDQSGVVQSKYGRDPTGGLISLKEGASPAVGALTDLHGDLVGTFTGTAMASSTAYSPFGEVLARTGTKPGLGYQGEYTDPDTGKVNMHARWYQPETGGFASRDTWTLSPVPSIQANRYLYANGTPLNTTDPLGHDNDSQGGLGAGNSGTTVLPPPGQVGGGGAANAGTGASVAGQGAKVAGAAAARAGHAAYDASHSGKNGSQSTGSKSGTKPSSDGDANEKNLCAKRAGGCGPKPTEKDGAKSEKNLCAKQGGCGPKPTTKNTGKNTGKQPTNNGPRDTGKQPTNNGPKDTGKQPTNNNPKNNNPKNNGPDDSGLNVGIKQPGPKPVLIEADYDVGGGWSWVFDLGLETEVEPIINCGPGSGYSYGSGGCIDGVAAVNYPESEPAGFDPDPPPPPISSCSPPNSFARGTRVLMADGSSKVIEDVQIGDQVVAGDPETGKAVSKAVTGLIMGDGVKRLVQVSVSSADVPYGPVNNFVVATEGHPFWVADLRKWVEAGQLHPGMWLQTSAGTHIQITAIRAWTTTQRVYNLSISDVHTYHVLAGSTPVLVHNAGPWDGDDGGWYGQLQPAGPGKEINHIPAKSAYGDLLPEYSGPSIRMDYADHRALYSTGSYRQAKAWQARQRELMADGRIDEAMAMDVRDIQNRFGSKYDAAIKEMYDSLPHNKAYQSYKAGFGGCP